MPRRRRMIRARLETCNVEALDGLVRRGDPFDCGTLWLAIEYLIATDKLEMLDKLEPLLGHCSAYEVAVFKALQHWHAQGRKDADGQIAKIGSGTDFDPFQRMGARGWALFLGLPKLQRASEAASSSSVFQFWDSERAPADVTVEMDRWQDLVGQRYARFNDGSAQQFLRDEFGSDAAKRFGDAKHPAIRSDYFRLGYLAARGGVYVDADSAVQPDAPSLLQAISGHLVLVFGAWRGGLHILNGVISAPAQHPLIVKCFGEAGRRLDAGGRPVQSLAGGHMMTDIACRMARNGNLKRATSLLSTTIRQCFARSVQTAYKSDHRNWRAWDAAQA